MQTNFKLRSAHKSATSVFSGTAKKSRKSTALNLLELSPQRSAKQETPNKIFRRFSTTAFKDMPKNPSQQVSNLPLTDIIPAWLSSREDFKQNCQISAADLSKIVKKSFASRSPQENEQLFQWVSRSEFFKNIPQVLISDLCGSLSFERYLKDQVILSQDIINDRLFIVYEGQVGVFQESHWKSNVSSGGVFGEAALDREPAKKAEARALTDVKLLVLKYSDYKRITNSLKNLEKNLNFKLIKSVPLFTEMSYNKLQVLLNSCKISCFGTGDVIYDLDSQASCFYIIQKGVVALQVHVLVEKVNKWPVATRVWTEREVRKKYAVLFRQCREGDYFGEYEILKGCSRNMKAVVLEPCQCIVFNSDWLRENFWIRDAEKINLIKCEYEKGIFKTEEGFKKNLNRKTESERLLKCSIGSDTKRAIRLKELLAARKQTEDLMLKRQIVESHKNERVKRLGSEKTPVFRTFEEGNI